METALQPLENAEVICRVSARDSGKTLVDAGFGEVLARMAAGEFESPAGQESLLEEIERVSMGLGLPEGLDAELAEELMGGGRVSFEARRRETAVLTALRMQFVTLGM